MVPWKTIRKIMPQPSNMIELQTFQFALQCLYITTVGSITELGYKLYLSLLSITGKNSFINEPPRKTYIWFLSIDELKQLEFVSYNDIKHEYFLTDRGVNMLTLLAKGLTNQGVPKL
tara:strand:+ start:336 stop:686 length:351 start_codon:yes stop_codon:yes gene_type:complete